MRLSEFQIATINNLAKKYFGQDTTVFLFGSRTDDTVKGGDIDLLIRNKKGTELTVDAKIHFLAELKRQIGDQKIDVVFDNVLTRQKKFFYQSIMRHKIEL
jgi:uncharacterized protein